MPGFTIPLAIPYPLPTDPADVPSDVQALAERVDVLMTQITASVEPISHPDTVVVAGGTQPILNGILSSVAFNSVVFDNASMADTSNPAQILVAARQAGVYLVTGTVAWAPNNNGAREFQIIPQLQPPVVWKAQSIGDGVTGITTTGSFLLALGAGEHVLIQARQSSTLTLNITSAQMMLTRVSP
jgi:hypothetical protein